MLHPGKEVFDEVSEPVESFVEVGVRLTIAFSTWDHGDGPLLLGCFPYLFRIVPLVRNHRLRSAVIEKAICHCEIADVSRREKK